MIDVRVMILYHEVSRPTLSFLNKDELQRYHDLES
jgi:hypothetical protein